MKKLLLFLIPLLTINCYSQISFEKGYYIDNSGQKTECLIKNNDWASSPIDFKFKLTENDDSKTIGIESVKEFGIYNITKYIRAIVEVDISGDGINELISNQNPEFSKQQLFLKVLIEGKAKLYEGGSPRKFFYNVENSNIEQLIFKTYKNTDNQVETNNQFRKQLWDNLQCSSLNSNYFSKLEYKKNALIALFSEYNKCINPDFINYITVKKQKGDFNLNLRPRLNNSSLVVESELSNYKYTDFGNKTTFGFGVEAEFILPLNKNKWAVLLEPTYQNLKKTITKEYNATIGGELIAKVDYSSIEVPLGIRHYFFLNNNSKVFINASLVYDICIKPSAVEFSMADRPGIFTKDFDNGTNLAFGIGYKLYNKFSLEMRYQTERDNLSRHKAWNSNYKTTSIILGYTLF